jgi:putative DNA primase/helicase
MTYADSTHLDLAPPLDAAIDTRAETAITAINSYLDRGWQIFLTPWTGEAPTHDLPELDDGGNPLALWNKKTDRAVIRQAFDDMNPGPVIINDVVVAEASDLRDDLLIALATGPISNVMVLRVPVLLYGALEALALSYDDSCDVIPNSDGDDHLCFFFKWPVGLVSSKDSVKPKGLEQVEVLGDGNCLRLPPTIGRWWLNEHDKPRRIVDAPDWLLGSFGLQKMMDETAKAALDEDLKTDADAPDDNAGPDVTAPEPLFKEYDSAEPKHKTTEPDDNAPAFSEDALALVFTGQHGATLRYVAKWGKWLIYDGKKWNFDETLKTFSLARQICRAAARRCNKPREGKAIASAKTRSAVVSLASSDSRHAATVEQWDADPWLLNTPDGVVDLRTGKTRPHRAADHMTKICAVTPDAKCPTPLWDAFLATITGNDIELQKFLQRMSGYGLTGVTIEHALFFLYGTGANGKGVFINTVAGVMGDYHRTAPLETFTDSNNERHPTELAMLHGARLVTVAETEANKRWSESRIKTLTGGDPIDARFMRQDFFTYTPQFKLNISGNHRPGLNSVNEAIRRRVNMLPFAVTIPEAQRDKNLTEKLKAEWPGILAWMIEGCLEWQKVGMRQPQVVRDATDEYLKAEDQLGRWIEECLEHDPNGWASSTDLFYSWKQWAVENGEWVGSQRKLSIDLTDAGFKSVSKKTGNGFAMLRLKPAFAGAVVGGCNAPGATGKPAAVACVHAEQCGVRGTCVLPKS